MGPNTAEKKVRTATLDCRAVLGMMPKGICALVSEGNLCVGKHDKKSGSDTSSNNFFYTKFEFHFISSS